MSFKDTQTQTFLTEELNTVNIAMNSQETDDRLLFENVHEWLLLRNKIHSKSVAEGMNQPAATQANTDL